MILLSRIALTDMLFIRCKETMSHCQELRDIVTNVDTMELPASDRSATLVF